MKFSLQKNSSYGEVPDFEVSDLAGKSHDYCVMVFVLNEGERIRSQLQRTQPYIRDVDLIIADGGSTDGALYEDFLRQMNVTALLVKKGEGRLSAQMRMGISYALEKGYRGVIVMDGNNKDNPEAIPRFVEALKKGYDHVQGSRFIPGGKEVNTPFIRKWALRLIHAPLIRLGSGFPYTDTTNGFRAYSREFLLDEDVQPFRHIFSNYELHYYLAVRAGRLKKKITEVPVERAYPKGKTPTKISFWKGNMGLLWSLFEVICGKHNPSKKN